jgi:hypothetical protein
LIVGSERCGNPRPVRSQNGDDQLTDGDSRAEYQRDDRDRGQFGGVEQMSPRRRWFPTGSDADLCDRPVVKCAAQAVDVIGV